MRISDWSSDVCSSDLAKPGGVLLFHRLSDSTIGAVWFHGRVRDGIGWVTDAMATKLWSQRSGLSMRVFPSLVRRRRHLSPWLSSHKRSEAHTSELQSLMCTTYDVFCMKKKNHYKNKY